jgi:hypothetical protein
MVMVPLDAELRQLHGHDDKERGHDQHRGDEVLPQL